MTRDEIIEYYKKEQERNERDAAAYRAKKHKEYEEKLKAKKPSYYYKYDTDPLGYQTGDMPRENWFRDRDDY